jgi:hypothetical protein
MQVEEKETASQRSSFTAAIDISATAQESPVESAQLASNSLDPAADRSGSLTPGRRDFSNHGSALSS